MNVTAGAPGPNLLHTGAMKGRDLLHEAAVAADATAAAAYAAGHPLGEPNPFVSMLECSMWI